MADPLLTVAEFRRALLRLVGTVSDDPEFSERGEASDEVLDLFLTRGAWAAQRYLLKCGYYGWRRRSAAALTWLGADATDGGRYAVLPTDFLRAYGAGSPRRGALVEPDGSPWGEEIQPRDATQQGDGYYFLDTSRVWLTRRAAPSSTLYLLYHYRHPGFTGLVDPDIDMPSEARYLVVAEAANEAKEEYWLPGGQELEQKIERVLIRAREKAQSFARLTTGPRKLRAPRRYGNRW